MSVQISTKIILLIAFGNFVFPNAPTSSTVCIDWDKSNGTRPFVDRIFNKYGINETNGLKMYLKNFNNLLESLNIGTVVVNCQKDDHECIENREASHSVESTNINITRRKRATASVLQTQSKEIEQAHTRHWKYHIHNCYKSKKFLEFHKINVTAGITEEDFIRICPSLVLQIDNKICVHHHKKIEVVDDHDDDHHDEDGHDHAPPQSAVWGYGLISITIISLLSLSVIMMIPCLKKSFYHKIMAFLVALAIGTLAGDAMLHLIPHAFVEGANSATNVTLSSADKLGQHYAQVWRALMVLFGMYAFFIVEQLMTIKALCSGSKGHSHHNKKDKTKEPTNAVTKDENPFTFDVNNVKSGTKDAEMNEDSSSPLTALSCQSGIDMGDDSKDHEGHFHVDDRHHHHHHGGDKEITAETKIASVAWMVIVGDGFHNFSDGLAIGAAFSASISSGLSTAIAVFCHELPHELGDFAVLIQSGMTIRQAIVYNIVSAILAYIGLAVGILAGGNELGRHFILSITAGLFLYISLADMLPELTHQDVPHQSRCSAFICQHIGILTGIAIMLVISLYEHDM